MEYPKYKVVVDCMTYNQSKYITDAMNGFTMQQTTFPFVCTIVDDASTDGAQEVIRKYVEQNFDFSEGSVAYHKETDYAHITYAQHKTNKNCYFAVLYLKENHYSQHKDKSRYLKEWREGVDYMALCEGDDYWIVSDKLEKQVRILEINEHVGLVYTRALSFDESSGREAIIGLPFIGRDQLLLSNVIPTLTTCFRIELYDRFVLEIKPDIHGWLMGDYPIWIWFSFHSDIFYIDQISCKYRVLSESASHSKSLAKSLAFLRSTYQISEYFAGLYGSSEYNIIKFKLMLVRYLENLDELNWANRFKVCKELCFQPISFCKYRKFYGLIIISIISKHLVKLRLMQYFSCTEE